MKRKLPVLNFALGLILFLLLGWGVQSWLQPKYPLTVKGDEIIPVPRELIIPTLSRQPYSNTLVDDVTRLNLFRKQRKKYNRPKPPKPKPRLKPLETTGLKPSTSLTQPWEARVSDFAPAFLLESRNTFPRR